MIEDVFVDYWAEHGLASENIPFDGRSDYVGFVNRGIPPAACSRAPKRRRRRSRWRSTAVSQGEQLDPCYHEACDSYDDGKRSAAGRDDERL